MFYTVVRFLYCGEWFVALFLPPFWFLRGSWVLDSIAVLTSNDLVVSVLKKETKREVRRWGTVTFSGRFQLPTFLYP